MFDIKYAAGVRKDLSKIDKRYLEKIKNAAESLTDFPDISNIKKVVGSSFGGLQTENR